MDEVPKIFNMAMDTPQNTHSSIPPPDSAQINPPVQQAEPHTKPKTRQKTSKTTGHSTNFADNNKGEKSSKKPKSKSVKSASKNQPTKSTSDVDVNAVPNPAPDTGNTSGDGALYPSGVVYHGVLPVVVPSTSSHLPTSTPGFSPLPPLAAFATSFALSSTAAISVPTSTPSRKVVGSQEQSHSTAPKHLSTVIIVLLAIGAAFLLVGCYVVYRVWSRPRKHHYPTPSLPILQEDYLEERKVDPEEESLFGGKERTSAQPGGGGVLLNWTQYPHVSVSKPPPALDINATRPGSPPRRKYVELTQKSGYAFTGLGATASNTTPRAVSRLSTMSASVYPGSPMSGNIGLAVTGSPLTADGTSVLQRSNSKPAKRTSTTGKNRQSMLVPDKRNLPSTYGTSDLYGGIATPVPPTPATPKLAVTPSGGGPGRTRVKAPYAPASLLRTSTGAKEESNPFEESQYILPSLSPMAKSDDCRERDTKALASALGLASPVPPSPQTIYPDDSITLAGDRRRSRSQFMSPTMEASANLGKLMLLDLQSMASLPDVAAQPSSSRAKPALTRKRVEEKPPRVPSPPPMPSLAQMALAHSNPQDFEDYRSPTYSIYGLYEADRKSRN